MSDHAAIVVGAAAHADPRYPRCLLFVYSNWQAPESAKRQRSPAPESDRRQRAAAPVNFRYYPQSCADLLKVVAPQLHHSFLRAQPEARAVVGERGLTRVPRRKQGVNCEATNTTTEAQAAQPFASGQIWQLKLDRPQANAWLSRRWLLSSRRRMKTTRVRRSRGGSSTAPRRPSRRLASFVKKADERNTRVAVIVRRLREQGSRRAPAAVAS